MKLCTFEVRTHLGRHRRLGAVTASGIVDLNFACASLTGNYKQADALAPPSMRDFLEYGSMAAARQAVNERVADRGANDETILYFPEQVRMLAPIPNPTSVRDFYAFEDHVKTGFEKRGETMPQEWYEMPVYYKGNRFSVIGHEHEVPWPDYTQYLDYELELGFVIGRDGYDLTPEVAHSYLFGVTIYNDFSARDIQRKEGAGGLGPAKGKDFATGLGPWITTADEIDVHDLIMVARVNGEEWSHGSSSAIMWSVEEIIAYISKAEGVHAGEIIGSGTVGFGCGLELGRKLQPGDVVFFQNTVWAGLSHAAIYIGGGRIIAAPHTGTNVQIQSVGSATSAGRP